MNPTEMSQPRKPAGPHRALMRNLDRIVSAGTPADADAETALCVRIVNAVNLLTAMMHLAAFATYLGVFERTSAEALGYLAARMACYAIAAAGFWRLARSWTMVLTFVFFAVVFQSVSPGWGGEFLLALLLILPLSVFRRYERLQSWAWFAGAVGLCALCLVSMHANAPPFAEPHRFYWPIYYTTLSVAAFALVTLISVLRVSLLRLYDQVAAERGVADALLRNILPDAIVAKLRAGQSRVAEGRTEATVIFLDLVGFTDLTRRLGPGHLIEVLDEIFSQLDEAATRLGVEKVKTVGDAYMAATGLTRDPTPEDARNAAAFALEARGVVERAGAGLGKPLKARVGMHTGPVVAGVLGRAKSVFDIWGEAVNVAARLESAADPGAVIVSEQTYWRVRGAYELKTLGDIDLKGQGPTRAYELVGPSGDPADEASNVVSLAQNAG